ncbi:MAG: hypothetical protein E4G93_04530 [Dehalococcoidia bacterium]|nr:MAG: hypothetical protein E4G93_04530 [Dehalococcoidia bacterium]
MADTEYHTMTHEELRVMRRRLADDLEDFEEMAAFHSINSPAHATSTERQAQNAKTQRMTDAIAEIDRLLGADTD